MPATVAPTAAAVHAEASLAAVAREPCCDSDSTAVVGPSAAVGSDAKGASPTSVEPPAAAGAPVEALSLGIGAVAEAVLVGAEDGAVAEAAGAGAVLAGAEAGAVVRPAGSFTLIEPEVPSCSMEALQRHAIFVKIVRAQKI
jgi:hypothetical protein